MRVIIEATTADGQHAVCRFYTLAEARESAAEAASRLGPLTVTAWRDIWEGAIDVPTFRVLRGAPHTTWQETTACRWFLLCENPATTTREAGQLGTVPCCGRCAARADRGY